MVKNLIEYIPAVIIIIGCFGLIRFSEFFSRLQTQTLIAVNVCLLIVIYGFYYGFLIKTILIALFIAVTSPVASHAIAKACYKKTFKKRFKGVVNV